MLGYMLVSAILLKRRTMEYAVITDGILESPSVDSPFVYGVFRPVICLPEGLEEAERRYVLLHERMHIRRRDHILKAVSFLMLAVYWYNPLVWLAYRLLSYDIELACDEAVIRQMSNQEQSDYAETLLRCASSNKNLLSPVAFGETNVKKRIRNILNYRKPAFWIMAVLLGVCIALCAGFFTDPIRSSDTDPKNPDVTPVPDSESKITHTVIMEDENARISYTCEDPELDTAFRQLVDTLMAIRKAEDDVLISEGIDNINDIRITDGEKSLGFMGGSMRGLTDDPAFIESSYFVEIHDGKKENYLLIRNDSARMAEILNLVNSIRNSGTPFETDDSAQNDEGAQQSGIPEDTVLTVESVLQNPDAYVNSYVHVLGNLPQSIAGIDESGNPILYLCGAEDTDQHIRIINYIPSDGSVTVEAYGTLVYLNNGELALSMDGYTIQQEETALTVEAVLANPDAYVNTIVYIRGNLPQSAAGMDENGNPVLYLCGLNDLNRQIRIVHFIPSDGSCPVEAFGTLIRLADGELALSMRGYTILQ